MIYSKYMKDVVKQRDNLRELLIKNDYLVKKIKYEQELIDETVRHEEVSDKLRDDFYAIAFMCYVYIDDPREITELDLSDHRNRVIGEAEVARNLMNCFFIFNLQMSLVLISTISLKEHHKEAEYNSEFLDNQL